MQIKGKRLIFMLLTVVMAIGLLSSITPPVFAAGNTIYIVDAVNPDSGRAEYTWAQLGNAVAALQDGDTLDMSEATPDATNRGINLGSKNVTLKGDPDKIYPLNITTNVDLGLDNFLSSTTATPAL